MDKKVCGFVIPDGSVPVCAQTKRGGEKKSHFPPNTSLHLRVASDRRERDPGAGGDSR